MSYQDYRGEVRLFKGEKPAGHSRKSAPAYDPILRGYAIAEAAAVDMANGQGLSEGHRNAIHAHFAALCARDGYEATSYFFALLAGLGHVWKDHHQ